MIHSSYDSLNIVFIIYCNKCYHYYIVQTQNFRTRKSHKKKFTVRVIMNNKFKDDTNFIKNFNDTYRNLKNSFRHLIIKTNIDQLSHRLNLESQLMHLFVILEIRVLNCPKKITNRYQYIGLDSKFVAFLCFVYFKTNCSL